MSNFVNDSTIFSIILSILIKSNERSEDSYKGVADFFGLFFFQEKVKIFSRFDL